MSFANRWMNENTFYNGKTRFNVIINRIFFRLFVVYQCQQWNNIIKIRQIQCARATVTHSFVFTRLFHFIFFRFFRFSLAYVTWNKLTSFRRCTECANSTGCIKFTFATLLLFSISLYAFVPPLDKRNETKRTNEREKIVKIFRLHSAFRLLRIAISLSKAARTIVREHKKKMIFGLMFSVRRLKRFYFVCVPVRCVACRFALGFACEWKKRSEIESRAVFSRSFCWQLSLRWCDHFGIDKLPMANQLHCVDQSSLRHFECHLSHDELSLLLFCIDFSILPKLTFVITAFVHVQIVFILFIVWNHCIIIVVRFIFRLPRHFVLLLKTSPCIGKPRWNLC